MKNVRCVILEDERMSQDILSDFVNRQENFELLGIYNSPTELIPKLTSLVVDVIFLDIEMPDINGFEFLEMLEKRPYVIVTSSHSEYALKGFEYEVNDFLLKPFTYSNFIKSIVKVNRWASEKTSINHVFIKVDGEQVRLNFSEITHVEALGDYAKIYTATTHYTMRVTMKEIEQSLQKEYFQRIHRSFIVNLNFISRIDDNTLLISKHVLPIGRSYRQQMLEKLNFIRD